MDADALYFGPEADFWRRIHVEAGVENALYVDDLFAITRKVDTTPARLREWEKAHAFYFVQALDVQELKEEDYDL